MKCRNTSPEWLFSLYVAVVQFFLELGMFLASLNYATKLMNSPILHCVSLCYSSYMEHHYLTDRLWTHVSDAIRMNDQVGELYLFTDSHSTYRVNLFSSEAQESESRSEWFYKALELSTEPRWKNAVLTTFGLFGLLTYSCELTARI